MSVNGSRKRVMVDMSATVLHHGHVRLLKKAGELGKVVVGLTSDEDLKRVKGIDSALTFAQRKEILESIRYVDDVVETPWLITDEILDRHGIDLLVHGDDNRNPVSAHRLRIFYRTAGISSEMLDSPVAEGKPRGTADE